MIDLGSTALNSILGGLLIGIASTLHLYLNGKITGISGSIFKCITLKNFNYNFSFLLGMVIISVYMKYYNFNNGKFFEYESKFISDLSLLGFIIAGFLVGFGAKMANGCTSGHGICGLPRFSKRSFVAIGLFMIFGGIVSTTRYYFPILKPFFTPINIWNHYSSIYYYMLIFFIACFLILVLNCLRKKGKEDLRDIIIAFIVGCIFSYGLIQSGMLKRHTIIEFLTISKIWNMQLVYVLGTAVGFNVLSFRFVLKKTKPVYKLKFDLPTNTQIDNKLILGASIFGIGWGLGGICPGTSIIGFYLYYPQSYLFFISMCLGIYLEYTFDAEITSKINGNIATSTYNEIKKMGKKLL